MSVRGRIAAAKAFLFGDSARAFGTLSLALLAPLTVVPARDYFRDWRGIQKQYLQLIHGRNDAPALARHFQGGVQQIWLPEIGVVDRCTTCHVGLKESTLTDVRTQPFRPHPPVPHSLTEFGCVLCHRGQGTATSVADAHNSSSSWEEPILPARYLESGCGQCHIQPLTGTPKLNQGRELLARYGCVRCHTMRAPDGTKRTGTDEPPSLEHIADKTSREWIAAWLRDPQAYAGSATMPNFQLKDDEIRDIAAFLIAQSQPYRSQKASEPAPVPSQDDAVIQQGASLYGESFCASCHAVQNAAGLLVGGNLGPELTRVGSKVKIDWLADWLRNPAIYDPNSAMPHYRFDAKQIGLLVTFLSSKTDSDFTGTAKAAAAEPKQIERGRILVIERGCASCHAINGLKAPEDFAPELTEVGSRPLSRILFAPGVPNTLPDYIAARIRDPRSFGDTLKMPRFSLPQPQVDAIVTALLAQTARAETLPASMRIPERKPSDYRPAGRAGKLMDEMRCFSCHIINGRGGTMAPELTYEGTSVQRAWLVNFLKNPNTLRPALIRRMPRFNVTDAEANTLADYIMTAWQTPDFEGDASDDLRFTAADVQSGRELFYNKYACQSCHIIDQSKDKGYVGPTLTQVGSRLTAPWILHWLRNAQTLRPGSLEPVWNMKDADARSITAFLMAQKGAPVKEAARK